jgi:hypothetical protein
VTFEESVRLVRAHVERQFPKTCGMCGQVFGSLTDYVRITSHVGQPVSYDAELDDWRPRKPVGTFALALCSCGTSLAIGSEGMRITTLWRLMRFARTETRRRGVTVPQYLALIRGEIDRQVLAEADALPAP